MITMTWHFFLTPILISLFLRKVKKYSPEEWKKMTFFSRNPYMIGGKENHYLHKYLREQLFLKENINEMNKLGKRARLSFFISNRLFLGCCLIFLITILIIQGIRTFFNDQFLM